jgi:hypothetical protein
MFVDFGSPEVSTCHHRSPSPPVLILPLSVANMERSYRTQYSRCRITRPHDKQIARTPKGSTNAVSPADRRFGLEQRAYLMWSRMRATPIRLLRCVRKLGHPDANRTGHRQGGLLLPLQKFRNSPEKRNYCETKTCSHLRFGDGPGRMNMQTHSAAALGTVNRAVGGGGIVAFNRRIIRHGYSPDDPG